MQTEEGELFKPRHTGTQGKHHRYYVAKEITLPAKEIEAVLLSELHHLLISPAKLAAILPEEQSDEIEAVIANAAEQAVQLKSNPCPAQIGSILNKVVISEVEIRIELSVGGLMSVLGLQVIDYAKGQETKHIVRRSMHLKRTGHGKRIILGNEQNGKPGKADPSLLKAIAGAHDWLDEMKTGSSYKEIALRENIDQRHIARNIRLAFLAPDITEAILQGREPASLNAEMLLKTPRIPYVWNEQRQLFDVA